MSSASFPRHQMIISNKCNGCFEEVVAPYLKLGTKIFHRQCCVCSECKEPFLDLQFLYVLDKKIHKNCFKCQKCGLPFKDSKFLLLSGNIIHDHCK